MAYKHNTANNFLGLFTDFILKFIVITIVPSQWHKRTHNPYFLVFPLLLLKLRCLNANYFEERLYQSKIHKSHIFFSCSSNISSINDLLTNSSNLPEVYFTILQYVKSITIQSKNKQ